MSPTKFIQNEKLRLMKKVIVIGLDGLEPRIVEPLLERGELPNLRRIQNAGGYSRIRTTYPAQTPVAWSTFSTGVNPGGHGIFDFLSRDPNTYLPYLSLTRYVQKNAFIPPKVVNNRRGVPVWDVLSERGIPSTIIRCPCTFPPEEIKGRMLAGLGVPDLRGGLGTSAFFTSAQGVKAEHAEKVIQVALDGGQIQTHLIGPRHPKGNVDLTFPITIHLNQQDRSITIHSEGDPRSLECRLGAWSDWLRIKFKSGLMAAVSGMVRFYLKTLDPVFELYASPINFDPAAPLFPISYPNDYAAEIQNRLGSFYTAGMAEDHDGLIYGRFDEAAFLDQCGIVLRERRRMMLAELNRFKEGLFYCLFDTPDRLQHMLWRFRDPAHPANLVNGYNKEYSGTIEEHYRSLDHLIEEVWKFVDDQTLFITLSDHGMNSFKRGLNLNTWLYENDFLALKNGYKPGEEENGDFFHNVDWSRTKAYALALGAIFLNLRGREANGIVRQDEAAGVKEDIITGLTGLVDEEKGQVAVRSVFSREQLYSGAYAGESGDLLVNHSPGYRVSWNTPLGGVPAGLFEDNTRRWGGDHVIDPSLIPGILFASQPIQRENPDLKDLAPTILAALGVPKHSLMEGNNLLA
jgi:predicted AlkP superfamily phosphohydrolase/phosphomutase